MKIAIPSTRLDLDGAVEPRLGMAAHMLVVETDDMSFEAVAGPPRSSGPGAGVTVVSQAVDMGARVVLVNHVAPYIVAAMEQKGIEIVTQVSGPVTDAVANYLASRSGTGARKKAVRDVELPASWAGASAKGLRQLYALLPRLVGVILLLGLFRGFVSEQALLSLFSGSPVWDSMTGAGLGSVLAGNPVNSYVIGDSLLATGVGLAGVMALLLAWVTVGVIRLPAEAAALGWRFALVRNVAAFTMAVLLALTVVFWPGGGV